VRVLVASQSMKRSVCLPIPIQKKGEEMLGGNYSHEKNPFKKYTRFALADQFLRLKESA